MAKNNRTAWTPAELARQWGKSPETIISLIRAGRLPATNVSLGHKKARWLIFADDIARFKEENQAKPPARRRRRARMSDDGETFGF